MTEPYKAYKDNTLLQLAAMSTCFAAGYAKARQDHEEKQAQQEQEND